LVIRDCLLVFVFCKEIQLKIGTKKIEWMAGTWKPRMPKVSVQKKTVIPFLGKYPKNPFFVFYDVLKIKKPLLAQWFN